MKDQNQDLNQVDWANLKAEDLSQMLVEAMNSLTPEDLEEMRQVESKYLTPVSPSPTALSKDQK